MDQQLKARFLNLLLASLSICGCDSNRCVPPSGLQQAVEARLRAGDPFRIDALTNFSWEKLFVFHPYTSIGTAASQAGVAEEQLRGSIIESHDQISLLVFVAPDTKVRCVDFARQHGDFTTVAAGVRMGREQRFVGRASDGRIIAETERRREGPE
jgi:hypothetical protein